MALSVHEETRGLAPLSILRQAHGIITTNPVKKF
jgi:hypothetical protein